MTPANWDIKQADFVARFNLKIERKFKLIENFKFYDIKMMNDIKLIYQKHPSYFNVNDIILRSTKFWAKYPVKWDSEQLLRTTR